VVLIIKQILKEILKEIHHIAFFPFYLPFNIKIVKFFYFLRAIFDYYFEINII